MWKGKMSMSKDTKTYSKSLFNFQETWLFTVLDGILE